MPLNDSITNGFKDDHFNHDFLIKKIDELSETNLSTSIRAELIEQLSKIITFNDELDRFSLLVNESGAVISKEDLTFTPVVRSEEGFHIPKSVKVDFMKSELYDLLISRFEKNFDRKEPKSRELQRSIKSVVNLQPYDSNNVIDKIISGTKEVLKITTNIVDKINCIKEMVLSLYANFKNIENRQDKLKITVPLISKANTICDSESLYLSNSYPSGTLTEIIYEGMLKPNDYLESLGFWALDNHDSDSIESFFLWLGVNKYSKIIQLKLQNNWAEKEFIEFIFNNGTAHPDNFDINRILADSIVSKLDRFSEILKLSVNRIILLAVKDSFVRKLLESNDEKISWYYVTWRPAILTSYSYMRFQFLRSNLFTKYILEEGSEDLNKLINEDFQIDYEFLSKYGIVKSEVKSILIKLGAKESFNDLSPQNVYDILKTIPDKDPNKKGRATQTIYKMALESLVKQESIIPVPDDLDFFSRKGIVEEYKHRSAVYYSDNSILPRKILNTLPILNLPKRTGEDNVVKYFGVKSLREFKIRINEHNLRYSSCDSDMNRLFESLKPYILAYRLESPNLKKRITDAKTKRDEAKILKQCRIHIVTNCQFSFGEMKEMSIEEKEFINIKDIFYFKESSLRTIDELKKDSLFCDAFAEMMCIIFKVNDLKNDFRQILKNDINDTIHLVNQDLDNEKVEEAFRLLGVSRVEFDFWKNIFDLKKKKLLEPIETTDILKQMVFESLGVMVPDGYLNVDFENFGNSDSYDLISIVCNALSLSISEVLPTGLYHFHRMKFIACIKDDEYRFKQFLWAGLNCGTDKQSTFIPILNDYNINLINRLESEILKQNFNLIVDYPSIVKTQILKVYQVDMKMSVSDKSEILNLYEDLLKTYKIEEADVSDESIRSLLYFSGNAQFIQQYLIKQFGKEDEEFNASNENQGLIGELIDALLSRNSDTQQLVFDDANTSWVHSTKVERGKKRRGKNAEALVYNTLVEKYGVENVKWVSGNSTTPDKNDKLHYDLEYKNKSGEWKYVEVKAISDNQFVISVPEKNKGISEPDRYEMALVNNLRIFMVRDIFKFKPGETFESNSKFNAYAKDYVFAFDLESLLK